MTPSRTSGGRKSMAGPLINRAWSRMTIVRRSAATRHCREPALDWPKSCARRTALPRPRSSTTHVSPSSRTTPPRIWGPAAT